MADLIVKIDRRARVARFSGRGTFSAKEEIKRLGVARWLQGEKAWELRDFALDHESLIALFPGAQIEETGLGDALPPTAQLIIDQPDVNPALPRGVSVTELSSRVRSLLAQTFPGTIFVFGVLSNVKRLSGRVFIDLADEERRDEYLSCVIWANEEEICQPLTKLGLALERDLQVMFEVRVDLSRKDGRLSLPIVGVVAEYTAAKLAAQRELTNQRLRDEGLFDRNKKLAVPFLPYRLGVLTSAGGTVINDFQAALDEARFGFELYWLPVNVQGTGAKQQIIRGLKQLSVRSDLDAILLFRGGGSQADLSVFNDYDVAKAVCLATLPVISAIGHETDQCSTQDVSSLCCGVPKDIGRYFADLIRDLRRGYATGVSVIHNQGRRLVSDREQQLESFVAFLAHAMDRLVCHRGEVFLSLMAALPQLGRASAEVERRRLDQLVEPLFDAAFRLPDTVAREFAVFAQSIEVRAAGLLSRSELMLRALAERLSYLCSATLSGGSDRLRRITTIPLQVSALVERTGAALDALNTLFREIGPEAQLKRGFALIRLSGSEQYVTRGAALNTQERIEIQFHDMKKRALVE